MSWTSWMSWSGVRNSSCCPWPRDCTCSPSSSAPVATIDLERSADDWEQTLRQLQSSR